MHDPLTPCDALDEVLATVCGSTPTLRYGTGVRCRTDAPGATLDACQHGTPWLERCGRCEGEPPAPSPVRSPSVGRQPHPYGLRTDDPLGRTVTRDDAGKPFQDRIPRHPCPDCSRPRAKGHKGDHTERTRP